MDVITYLTKTIGITSTMLSSLLPIDFSRLSSYPFSDRSIIKLSIGSIFKSGFASFVTSTILSTTVTIQVT